MLTLSSVSNAFTFILVGFDEHTSNLSQVNYYYHYNIIIIYIYIYIYIKGCVWQSIYNTTIIMSCGLEDDHRFVV